MPPDIMQIPMPFGRGRDAADYLEAHGYASRVPPMRAGHLALVGRCPFLYYLTERLALTSVFNTTEAMAHGSWFHKRLEWFDRDDADQSRAFAAAVEARLVEMRCACDAIGLAPTERDRIIKAEEHAARTAWTWYGAARTVPVAPTTNGLLARGFEAWLRSPRHVAIGREVLLVYRHPRYQRTPMVGRLDLLLWHRDQNTLWIVDAKTTSKSTVARAQTCPFEDQTQFYLYLVNAMLTEGVLAAAYPEYVNEKTRLGGIRHLIVRKPSIRLSGEDREFTVDTTPLKRGPRKGQPRNERVYHGEPSFDRYMERVYEWYHATGMYTHEAARRGDDPVVNLSTTPAAVLDDWALGELHDRLDVLYRYATKAAVPSQFPRCAAGMTTPGSDEPTVYARFYAAHPREWPDLIRQSGLVQSPRDPSIDSDTPTGVYS